MGMSPSPPPPTAARSAGHYRAWERICWQWSRGSTAQPRSASRCHCPRLKPDCWPPSKPREARIGDLAAVDHCSQPTMTTQVRRLEDAGLVTRTADPGDARAVRIRITPEGIRTLTAVRADRAAAIEPQLALLPPADRRVLADAVDVLRRLLDHAATTPGRATRQ